ncbi:hypothetical protein V8E54_013373 [Elaphomyces granulatus]
MSVSRLFRGPLRTVRIESRFPKPYFNCPRFLSDHDQHSSPFSSANHLEKKFQDLDKKIDDHDKKLVMKEVRHEMKQVRQEMKEGFLKMNHNFNKILEINNLQNKIHEVHEKPQNTTTGFLFCGAMLTVGIALSSAALFLFRDLKELMRAQVEAMFLFRLRELIIPQVEKTLSEVEKNRSEKKVN